jgi:hypothetical protein
MAPSKESFLRRRTSYLRPDIRSTAEGTLIVTIVYLIVAALVICACLFLLMRRRSRA